MAKIPAPKCKVIFAKAWHGGWAAELRWQGHTLNVKDFPNSTKRAPTAKQKARARKLLMRGCTELAYDYRKDLR